jgi:predicted alpha/beta-fold hydrolase
LTSTFPIRLLALLAIIAASLATAETGDEGDEGSRNDWAQNPPPKFVHPYSDGLYSTVVAINMFGLPPEFDMPKKAKLKVPNFKKEVPVYSIMKEYSTELVVVLMGVDGKVEGPWGELFPYWYSEAGFHVLTFDSSFAPTYPDISGLGVVGNFEAEADQVAMIIDAFLKSTKGAKNITKIGVVGMSFGATQALLLAAKAKEGKLPFELSACLAISPPVKLKTAARVVDKYFRDDRWDTTMIELGKKFVAHAPVAEGEKIPFEAAELRAAIGYAFKDGLTKVIERNDRAYKLKLLPSVDSGEHRESYAEATSFEQFVEKFTFPYWKEKGAVNTAEDLWAMGDLAKILPRLPAYAEAIVAENDPFNDPAELAAAKGADRNKNLTVVPNGGHLGFISNDWTLIKSLRIFGKPVRDGLEAAPPADHRTREEARKEAADALEEALKQEIPPDPKKKRKDDKDKKKD